MSSQAWVREPETGRWYIPWENDCRHLRSGHEVIPLRYDAARVVVRRYYEEYLADQEAAQYTNPTAV
jgi:hypothetical protein